MEPPVATLSSKFHFSMVLFPQTPRVFETLGVFTLPLCQRNLLFYNHCQKSAVKWYNFGTAQAKNLFFKKAFAVTLMYKGLQGKTVQAPLYKRGV
jgi:hypothetical protein